MADPIEPASPTPAETTLPRDLPLPPVPAEQGENLQKAAPVRNTPWPRLARAEDVPYSAVPPEEHATSGNSNRILVWVAAQVCGFGLLVGGYFLGQAWPLTPSRAAPPDMATPGHEKSRSERMSNERALDAADRALKAERSHDFRATRAIYEEMLKRQVPLPGAEYRLALLSLHAGDLLQTEHYLNRSLATGDDVADCFLLRASLAGIKGNYADASTQLASAVRAKPFNARFCFCWGESLRREGKTADAIQRLTQTLDRPDNAAARALYLFKLRLAKVEAGNDEIFNDELASHAAQTSPGGDWQLFAAARAIGQKDYPAAAQELELARQALAPEIFSVYMQDFLFQSRAAQPELSAYLRVPAPTTVPSDDEPIQDPAVWTAAEADPAVWPPFPTTE